MGESPDPSSSANEAQTPRRISRAAPKAEASPRNPGDTTQTLPFQLPAALGWGVAAIFALVALWLSQRQASSRLEIAALESSVELERTTVRALGNELEAERLLTVRQAEEFKKLEAAAATLRHAPAGERGPAPSSPAERGADPGSFADVQIVRLRSRLNSAPDASAVVLWNPASREGLLAVENLPAPHDSQAYRLWIVDPSTGTPLDGGAFAVDRARGSGRHRFHVPPSLPPGSHFAVRRDRKSGAFPAEGELLLSGP